jgi:predicted transcriptional regulator of viral defense system
MKNPPISKRESEAIDMIRRSELIVFTAYDLRRFLHLSKANTNRIVQSMKRKELVQCVERGKYILTDIYNEVDIYEIVTHLFRPSYLAFWSALHFHHMTEQVPRSVFLASTKRKRRMDLQGQSIVYVALKIGMFFGYEKVGGTIVSDREKTIIDSLRHPGYSGGIEHIHSCIPEDLNVERISEYCELANSSAISSRLGYLLEKKGIEFDRARIGSGMKTYTLLDPLKGRVNPDSKWKLYVNTVIE